MNEPTLLLGLSFYELIYWQDFPNGDYLPDKASVLFTHKVEAKNYISSLNDWAKEHPHYYVLDENGNIKFTINEIVTHRFLR